MHVASPTFRTSLIRIARVAIAGLMITVVALGQQSFVPPAAPIATVDTKRESAVKGVYVFHFARYVKWPLFKDARAKEFRIGVLGESGIVGTLKKLAKRKTIRDRRTGVKMPLRILQFKSLKDYQDCQILVVPRSTSLEQRQAVTRKFSRKPVLLVGETTGFAQAEGTAGFLLMNGGIRFDLNVADAKRKGLSLDAKLLKAANRVEEKIERLSATATKRSEKTR